MLISLAFLNPALLAIALDQSVIDPRLIENAPVIKGFSSKNPADKGATVPQKVAPPMSSKEASDFVAALLAAGKIKGTHYDPSAPVTLDGQTLHRDNVDHPERWYDSLSVGFVRPASYSMMGIGMQGSEPNTGIFLQLGFKRDVPFVMVETTVLMSSTNSPSFTVYRVDYNSEKGTPLEVPIATVRATGSPLRFVFLLTRPDPSEAVHGWSNMIVLRPTDPSVGYFYGSTTFRSITGS